MTGAKVTIEEYGWDRIPVDGADHGQAFCGPGANQDHRCHRRRPCVWVVSGLTDLVVLKSTGSEFWGFPRDRYTTLAETTDRILATAVTARWRYASADLDWAKSYADVRRILLESFAVKHSLALQQTLYTMGSGCSRRSTTSPNPAVDAEQAPLPGRPDPLRAVQRHEVFFAGDRPQPDRGTVTRDDAPQAGRAWQAVPGF